MSDTIQSENGLSISEFEIDQLKEVINIGASHASTALSQMVEKRVDINVPEVIIDKVENISKKIGNENEVVTGILLKVLGDVPGFLVFLFPHDKSTSDFIRLITKQKDENQKTFDEYDISVLKEVGNILAGSALTAFSKFLDVNMVQSVSEAVTDMLGSVINTLMAELGKETEYALLFKVSFAVKEENIKTEFYFIIDPKATTKVLESTNAKMKK